MVYKNIRVYTTLCAHCLWGCSFTWVARLRCLLPYSSSPHYSCPLPVRACPPAIGPSQHELHPCSEDFFLHLYAHETSAARTEAEVETVSRETRARVPCNSAVALMLAGRVLGLAHRTAAHGQERSQMRKRFACCRLAECRGAGTHLCQSVCHPILREKHPLVKTLHRNIWRVSTAAAAGSLSTDFRCASPAAGVEMLTHRIRETNRARECPCYQAWVEIMVSSNVATAGCPRACYP